MIKDLIIQVRIDNRIVERKKEELEKLKTDCEVSGINYEREIVSGSKNNNRVEQNYLKLIEYKEEMQKYIVEATCRRCELARLIDKLKNDKLKKLDIMYLYCLSGYSMEKTAKSVGYSKSQTYRIFNECIKEIEDATKSDSMTQK